VGQVEAFVGLDLGTTGVKAVAFDGSSTEATSLGAAHLARRDAEGGIEGLTGPRRQSLHVDPQQRASHRVRRAALGGVSGRPLWQRSSLTASPASTGPSRSSAPA